MAPATCREAVLEAMRLLERRHGRSVHDLDEIVAEVLGRWPRWAESTVRTHVVSHMCRDAPKPQWPDLDRVDRGRYRRADVASAARTAGPRAAPPDPRHHPVVPRPETGHEFEAAARSALLQLWKVDLSPTTITLPGGVDKRFDLVSPDHRLVGDAKRYTTLKTPAAKWSTIAEYVWLLQKLEHAGTFLVFGGDADVPQRWLSRYRPLAAPVAFYFLDGHNLSLL